MGRRELEKEVENSIKKLNEESEKLQPLSPDTPEWAEQAIVCKKAWDKFQECAKAHNEYYKSLKHNNMKILRAIFFPGVPYPAAAIWHIILGSIVAALVGMVAFGYNGHGNLWLPITGSVVGLVAGAIVAVITRSK